MQFEILQLPSDKVLSFLWTKKIKIKKEQDF